MRAARVNTAQAMAAPSAESGAGPLYIINLVSANTAMALEAPDAPELGGFAVFRSRRVEDGRDRFRLHLGYFDSQEQAEKFLPLVRERYPAAWVALAPEDSMGSLDDTSVAQFKYIPHRKKPAAVAPAPAAQAAPPPARKAPAADPASFNTTIPAEDFLEAEDVLSLLETPLPAPTVVAPAPTPRPAIRPAAVLEQATPAVQSFAVQLVWSTDKPDTSQLPHLAIFDAYTMYTVTVKRGGRVWYGLRLGFFNDPVSARQVSLYVRSDFTGASVVPVSERECERAGEAAKVAVEKEAAARQQQRAQAEKKTALTLAPDPAPAAPKAMMDAMIKPEAKEIATAQANIRHTLRSLDGNAPLPAAKKPLVTQKKTPKKPVRVATGAARRGAFTTEQLLEELGAGEVSFEGEGHDPFTDTGVRHLSVTTVKKRKRMSGFFSRSST